MNTPKINPLQLQNDVLLTDVMIQLIALQQLLVKKGIFSREELDGELQEVMERVNQKLNNTQ